MTTHLSLEELVSSVAGELMGVTEVTMKSHAERVLHRLVDYFQVDTSFLRWHDRRLRTSTLVTEWPPRANIPDPDPLGVVYFADADPTFAATEHLSKVMTTTSGIPDDEYRQRVEKAAGVGNVSLAIVPLIDSGDTIGVLGFVKFGDRQWHQSEINALRAVSGLLAQLHGRVVAEERLRYLAYHDELTGLMNRRGLNEHLHLRLAAGAPGEVGLIFMDVDRLKALNSFLGHAAGDDFLEILAQRIKNGMSQAHFLARLSGDEFVLVMAGPADEAQTVAEAELLRGVTNSSILIGGEPISRAVSFGVAIGVPGVTNVSELLGQADQALLMAKSRGGNEINVFTPEMRHQNEIRTDIELHLGAAIKDGGMVLHYQPEVDLVNGRLLGFEALVRWQHPNLGLLTPNAFIDVLEATNLSGEMARWVIETGCQQLKEWHRRYPMIKPGMSVNISPAQLITVGFVENVAQILRDCELEGRYLTLEITEHAVFRDAESAQATLLGLKEIGVKVAIDDFGTGYSSFAQLKSLPVDVLKIDQTFVRDLGTDVNDLAIVRSIIGLAVSFGLQPVAEGVETEISASTLIGLGCRRAQGYLLGKPQPAENLDRLMEVGRVPRSSAILAPAAPNVTQDTLH